jgi:hypothetical protein
LWGLSGDDFQIEEPEIEAPFFLCDEGNLLA